MQGNKLVLNLVSHPVEMDVPAGLKVGWKQHNGVDCGADRQLLGQLRLRCVLSARQSRSVRV